MINEIYSEIINGSGYFLHSGFNNNETIKVKNYIEKKFLNRIKELSESNYNIFRKKGISNYHLNSNLIDHSKAWPRHIRLFDEEGIKIFKNTSFYFFLEKVFKKIQITNEIHNLEPEIVWRLVRPGSKNDVGPLHTDQWFWKINNWSVPKNKTCIKIWIMLGGEPKKSGLRVVANSQKNKKWIYSIIKKDGIVKPLFNEDTNKLKINILPTQPGNAVIFSYDLLHGGMVTKGDECRLSMEFTIFVNKVLS